MSPPVKPRPPAVARVLREVTETARRHRMFSPGDRVLAAVSGGPDSICLLHSLVRLRRLLKIDVACFHFDHGLREESQRDAAYVARQAARLGVRFVSRRARERPPRGTAPEAWGRSVRYQALTAVLEELGGGVAAVGHTADDRAETVLLALFRGGGLDAAAGMRAVNRPLVRPLIGTTRAETVAFCRSLRLRPRADPMNEDPAYMRSALRSAIPELERRMGRGIRAALARSAALLEEDADLLDQLSMDAERAAVAADGESVTMEAERLAALPRPIASRVIRRSLLALGVVPEGHHIESVLELARRNRGRAISLPQALKARRSGEYVRLSRSSPTGGVSASSAASGLRRSRRGDDEVAG